MIKDPLFQEETPYDLLELDPNARPEEVDRALPNFMRRRKRLDKLGLAQQAYQQLRTPRARLAVDLMYYNVDGLRAKEKGEPSPLVLDDFLKVPHFSPGELFCDLDLENFDDDLVEIVYHDFTFSPDPCFDRLTEYRLEVHMDR